MQTNLQKAIQQAISTPNKEVVIATLGNGLFEVNLKIIPYVTDGGFKGLQAVLKFMQIVPKHHLLSSSDVHTVNNLELRFQQAAKEKICFFSQYQGLEDNEAAGDKLYGFAINNIVTFASAFELGYDFN